MTKRQTYSYLSARDLKQAFPGYEAVLFIVYMPASFHCSYKVWNIWPFAFCRSLVGSPKHKLYHINTFSWWIITYQRTWWRIPFLLHDAGSWLSGIPDLKCKLLKWRLSIFALIFSPAYGQRVIALLKREVQNESRVAECAVKRIKWIRHFEQNS